MPRQRIGLLLIITCLVLLGCSGSTLGAVATATSTRVILPTVTPSPTAKPTQTPIINYIQSLTGGTDAVQSGDLFIAIYFGLAYPDRKLPDNLPTTPYQFSTQPPLDPAVNPNLTDPVAGFGIGICSNSGGPHIVANFGVTIQSFTAYSAQLNTWNPCSPIYTRQNGPQGNGCGGGGDLVNCMRATFPASATVGATASALANSACTNQAAPITITPASGYHGHLNVVMPTVPGTYTIALTLSADGGPTITVPFAHPMLLAPVAHDWDGQACTTSAMQSQIPTANPTTPYLCPKS